LNIRLILQVGRRSGLRRKKEKKVGEKKIGTWGQMTPTIKKKRGGKNEGQNTERRNDMDSIIKKKVLKKEKQNMLTCFDVEGKGGGREVRGRKQK